MHLMEGPKGALLQRLMMKNPLASIRNLEPQNCIISTENLHILDNYNNSILVNSDKDEHKPILYIGIDNIYKV